MRAWTKGYKKLQDSARTCLKITVAYISNFQRLPTKSDYKFIKLGIYITHASIVMFKVKFK